MSSVAEQIMAEVFARLTSVTPAPLIEDMTQIRRYHRTKVTREDGPAVHLIDGRDAPDGDFQKNATCSTGRTLEFRVVVFVRGDAGISTADPTKLEVHRRIKAPGYPPGVLISEPVIEPETEMADQDATRLNMDYKAKYTASNGAL